ncbi:MAG: 50S ribosomal protein L21 [Burkholderiales bacterium]
MYAVIKSGGKQHRVSAGQKVKVERLSVEVGDSVVINDVLMVGSGEDVKIGTPTVAGATVQCKVVAHGLGDKVRIFKIRRRKHYQKHQGHRQGYTELQVTAVNA